MYDGQTAEQSVRAEQVVSAEAVLNADPVEQARNARELLGFAVVDWLSRDARSWPSNRLAEFCKSNDEGEKERLANRINRDIKVAKRVISEMRSWSYGKELLKRFIKPELIDAVLATPEVTKDMSAEDVQIVIKALVEFEEIVKERDIRIAV